MMTKRGVEIVSKWAKDPRTTGVVISCSNDDVEKEWRNELMLAGVDFAKLTFIRPASIRVSVDEKGVKDVDLPFP